MFTRNISYYENFLGIVGGVLPSHVYNINLTNGNYKVSQGNHIKMQKGSSNTVGYELVQSNFENNTIPNNCTYSNSSKNFSFCESAIASILTLPNGVLSSETEFQTGDKFHRNTQKDCEISNLYFHIPSPFGSKSFSNFLDTSVKNLNMTTPQSFSLSTTKCFAGME